MSDHIALDMLDAFSRGDLGDHAAALVARHLDDCATCTARALSADPLTAAMRVPEPEIPAALVARVLAATAPPRHGPARGELIAGVALIAAGLLAWLTTSDLSALGERLDVLGSALVTTHAQLRAQPALLASLAASSAAAAALGVGFAARFAGRAR